MIAIDRQLMMAFLQDPLSKETVLEIAGSLSPRDWEYFLERVCREGISGYLYHLTGQSGLMDVFPGKVRRRLEYEYMVNLGRNILIKKKLAALSRTFEDHQLDVLLVRGAVLIHTLYPSGVRPLLDIDLVLKADDLPAVSAILARAGYETPPGMPFFYHQDHVHVDLHLERLNFWKIKSLSSMIDMNNPDLMEKTEPFLEYAHVRIFDLYDTIISCCDHLQYHSFERLIWFMDIVQCVKGRDGPFDWCALALRARRRNLLGPVYFVFQFLSQNRLLQIPSEALKALEPDRMGFFERRSLRQLCADERPRVSGELLILLGSVPGFWKKLRVIGEFLSPGQFAAPAETGKRHILTRLWRGGRIFLYILGKIVLTFAPLRRKDHDA